jgi:hypothetical protein
LARHVAAPSTHTPKQCYLKKLGAHGLGQAASGNHIQKCRCCYSGSDLFRIIVLKQYLNLFFDWLENPRVAGSIPALGTT